MSCLRAEELVLAAEASTGVRPWRRTELLRQRWQASYKQSSQAELRLADRWSLLTRAGLDLKALAADRNGPYRGKGAQDLPNLSTAERQVIMRKLAEQLSRAAHSLSEASLLTSSDAGDTDRADNVEIGGSGSYRFRQVEQENEVLEQEILGLIAEQRASLWINRAMLAGALIALLLATLCAFLFGIAIVLLIL